MGNGNGGKSPVQFCERKPLVYVKVLVKCEETGIALKNVKVCLIKKGKQVYEIKTDKSGVALFKPGEKGNLEGLYGIRFSLPDNIGRKYYRPQQRNINVQRKPVIEFFKLQPKKANIEVKVKWEGEAQPEYTVHLRKNGEEEEKDEHIDPAQVEGESAMLSLYEQLEHGSYVVWLTVGGDEEARYKIPERRTVAVEPGGREKVKINLKERGATLEFELVDTEDHPIPEEEYEIWTMGGEPRKITGGKLDKRGQAHARDRGIEAERIYEIRFPRYDLTDIVTPDEAEELLEEEEPREADEPRKDYYGAAEVFFLDEKTGRVTPSAKERRDYPRGTTLRDLVIKPDQPLPKIYYRLQRPENIKSAAVSVQENYPWRAIWEKKLKEKDIKAGEGTVVWDWSDKAHWKDPKKWEKEGKRYESLATFSPLHLKLKVETKDPPHESLGDEAWSYIHVERRKYGVLSVRFCVDLERSQVFPSKAVLDEALELMRQDMAFTPGEDRVEIEWELVGHERIRDRYLQLQDKDGVTVWSDRAEVGEAADRIEWDGKINARRLPAEKGKAVGKDRSPLKLRLQVNPKDVGYECVAEELWTYIYIGERGPRHRTAAVEEKIRAAAKDMLAAKGMAPEILDARRQRLLELWEVYGGHLLHFKTDAIGDAKKRQELIGYVQDALVRIDVKSEELNVKKSQTKEGVKKILKGLVQDKEKLDGWLGKTKRQSKDNPGGGDCLFWSIHQLISGHSDSDSCRDNCRAAMSEIRTRSTWHLSEIINNRPCEHNGRPMNDFKGEGVGTVSRGDFLETLNLMLDYHKEGFANAHYHPLGIRDKWQWYLNHMAISPTWGDLIVLCVISHLYRARITCWQQTGAGEFSIAICNAPDADKEWAVLNEGNYHFKALLPQPV